MQNDFNNEQNMNTFLRSMSKRSQTMISTSANLFNFVPTIHPKSINKVFSPLLLFKASEGNLPEGACYYVDESQSKLDLDESSNSTPTSSYVRTSFLTPPLKKRNTILERLKQKRKEFMPVVE